jgi:hypothetical protein
VSGRDGNLLAEVQRDALDGNVPLADTLRKLVALGGQAGSVQLPEWASRELRGYASTDAELPHYRKPGAVLQADALKGNYQITGQQISPRMLPDVVQKYVGEVITLGQPVGDRLADLRGGRAAVAAPPPLRLIAAREGPPGDRARQARAAEVEALPA